MIADRVIRYIYQQTWIQKSIPYLILIWTLLIVYLTLFPSESIISSKLFSYDKLGHFGMFGGWTGLIGLYYLIYKRNYHAPLLIIMITGVLFGGFIELMQYLLPYDRHGNIYDIIANTLGCLTAYFILNFLRINLLRVSRSESSTSQASVTMKN